MARGIIIFGPSGTGKTTLGKMAADALGWPYFDIDDYIWKVKFTQMYPREERKNRLLRDTSEGEHFVMAGSMDSFHDPFDPLFDLAVFLNCDWATRKERLRQREYAQFGDRILPGGELHEQYLQFMETSRRYYDDENASPSQAFHTKWAKSLPCPVLYLDGAQPPDQNLQTILQKYAEKAAL